MAKARTKTANLKAKKMVCMRSLATCNMFLNRSLCVRA